MSLRTPSRLLLAACSLYAGFLAAYAQEGASARRILVTPDQPAAETLTQVELELRVGGRPAEILRVFQPQERPVQLGVVISEAVGPEAVQSLPALANFLRSLPAGSQAAVGYAQTGAVAWVQPFTPDLQAAAAALRSPRGALAPTDLAQLLTDALEPFPQAPPARPQLLFIGEGTTPETSPYDDFRLNRLIRRAQERGVVLWVIHAAPAAGPPGLDTETLLQSYLERMARETGGRAFGLGLHPPTLDPYLEDLRGHFDRQLQVEFAPLGGRKRDASPGKLSLTVRGRKLRLLYPER
jgi:hypothetical protein